MLPIPTPTRILLALCTLVYAQLPFASETRNVLVPGEYGSQAGPTLEVEFLTESILETTTDRVPGTPANHLYLPKGKRYWDTEESSLIYGDFLDPDELAALAMHPESQDILFVDESGELTLYDSRNSTILATYTLEMGVGDAAFVSGKNTILAFGNKSSDSLTIAIDKTTGETLWESSMKHRIVLDHLRTENRLIEYRNINNPTKLVTTRNATTGELLGTIEGQSFQNFYYRPSSFLLDPNSLYSIVNTSSEVQILNAITGDVFLLEGTAAERTNVYSLSNDAKLFALYRPLSRAFELRSAATGELVADLASARTAQSLSSDIRWFDFSQDDSKFYVVDSNLQLTEWEVEEFKLSRDLGIQESFWGPIGLVPGEGLFISAKADTAATEVWDIAQNKHVATLPFKGSLIDAAFSPSGDSIALLQRGGVTSLYSLADGSFIQNYPDDSGLAYQSCFISSRNSFISYHHNKTVQERAAGDLAPIARYEIEKWISELYAIDPNTGYALLHDSTRQTFLYNPFEDQIEQTYNSLYTVEYASFATAPQVPATVALSGAILDGNAAAYRIAIHTSEQEEAVELISLDKESKRFTLSPDGGRLAYSTFNENFYAPLSTIYIKSVGTENSALSSELNGNLCDLFFTADNGSLYTLWYTSDQKLRISRHDPNTAELLETLPFQSGQALERNEPRGHFFQIPNENKVLVATSQNVLYIVGLSTGATLAQRTVRPDTPGFYSVIEEARVASFSGDGKRMLYQDAQGLLDSWILGEIIPHPLGLANPSQSPSVTLEAKGGESYFLEKSSELSIWTHYKDFEPTTDQTIELPLPMDSPDASFVRAFKVELDSE